MKDGASKRSDRGHPKLIPALINPRPPKADDIAWPPISKPANHPSLQFSRDAVARGIQMLRIDDVAAIAGVSKRTVERWIKENRLASILIGRVRRIREADLVAFLEGDITTSTED